MAFVKIFEGDEMEIYIKNQIHQNLLDSFTRKYNELLYVMTEMESIYYSLDEELRATVAVHELFYALKNEMSELALNIRKHKEFLADAEGEYFLTERSIMRSIEGGIPDRLFNNLELPVNQTDSIFRSVSSLEKEAIHNVLFTYLPASALSGIQYKEKEMENIDGFKATSWKDSEEKVERDYDTYKNIVTLSDVSPGQKPQTSEEYRAVVFQKLKIAYSEHMESAMTDYGWYPTTIEDAVDMAGEGYPALLFGSSGFMGMVLPGNEKETIMIFNELGKIATQIEPDMCFYIHS